MPLTSVRASPSPLDQRAEQLHSAINEGDEETVRALLQGEDAATLTACRGKNGRTPLIHAAEARQPGIMRLLLDTGSAEEQTMAVDRVKGNALMHAAVASNPECMQVLLNAHDPKAQADAQTRDGSTTLQLAALHSSNPGGAACVLLLLDLEPQQEQLDLAFEWAAREYSDKGRPVHLAKVIERMLGMGARIPARYLEALGPIIAHLARPSRLEEERVWLEEERTRPQTRLRRNERCSPSC
jgi:hypothetical protein